MSNRLSNEKSPYLLEHAENPVDWYPWCREAFEKARRENKPIFLSIGYSTCHWCHVMARESFEDEQVAAILNRHYVSIKVDREERPDVDAVYMQACLALNGSGGWPLTVIMTPEQQPFFAATYMPKDNIGGRVGLIPFLKAVAVKWNTERKDLIKACRDLGQYLENRAASPEEPSMEHIDSAVGQLTTAFDEEYGGFGNAPKFPAPHKLLFLLRYAQLSGSAEARRMVEVTLRQMYRGGIFDHFGGGFARYSTDREWLAPHFEKTLYDNALLAIAYTEAWQQGRMAMYRHVAESTLDYCLRELLDEKGGFYCGQDADSDGVEGAYYLFSPAEIKNQLGEDAGRHFCECYDITEDGNFEGLSIPNLLLNDKYNMLPEGYGEFREKLRLYREERLPLRTDDKILTSWNGLMLMALSKAAWVFKNEKYLKAAEQLAAFLKKEMGSGDKLMARYCRGEVRFMAQLDDYAFYALGLLELYRADFDPVHISLALSLAEQILLRFSDSRGGFFRTADDAEKLISRPKELHDGAMPSGNSAAAMLFSQLYHLTGDIKWRERRSAQLSFICGSYSAYTSECAFAMCALLEELYPTKELVCVAPSEEKPAMLDAITSKYAPELSVLFKSPATAHKLAEAAPFTAAYNTVNGKAAFYVCENGTCSLPITE